MQAIILFVVFLCFATLLPRLEAFEFKFPWDTTGIPNLGTSVATTKALQPGDTIAVVGASGNVGKLVALRLSDTYKVNGIVRDASSVSNFLNRESITLFEADLLEERTNSDDGKCPLSLKPALENANAVIICTGTTAFPTKAWTKSGSNGVAGDVVKALLDNSFDVKKAIASLDEQGFNTPKNIDALSNRFLVNAWKDACKVPRKRLIMLSSIGVQRRDQMPFPILNACGVLDAKAEGEEAIQSAAKKDGFSYTVIRPGQLFGGPYDNNYYLGTLFQLDKDAKTQDVKVALGDTLVGDTLRSTLAEVTAQICEGDFARDMDFAVVNVQGEAPNNDRVQDKLSGLTTFDSNSQ